MRRMKTNARVRVVLSLNNLAPLVVEEAMQCGA
jgi:hypothetical protein